MKNNQIPTSSNPGERPTRKRQTKPIASPPSSSNETSPAESSQSSAPLPNQSNQNSSEMSSPSIPTKKETSSRQPEIPLEIDQAFHELMELVEPHLQKITRMFHNNGMPVRDVNFKVSGGAQPKADVVVRSLEIPSDLMNMIKGILDKEYGISGVTVMNIVMDKNLLVASSIGRILVDARNRDKDAFARELQAVIQKLKY